MTLYQPGHRREPATRGRTTWRAPLAVVLTLTALLVPVSSAFAVPGSPGGDARPAGSPATPGQADPSGKPGPTGQPEGPTGTPEPEVWTGVPGTHDAHDSYGYPWPAAPDCDESNVSSGGCVNDGLGFFQGQCTSWVAYRLGQRNDIAFSNWFEGRHWGNASEWSKVAKSLDHVSNKVPAVGAVGWYARGHVSYVEDVNDDGSLVISEMNTDGHNGFVVHTVEPGDSSWPDRFLHLADVVPVDLTAPERPERLTAAARPGGVALRWRVPADDIGVTGYRVLRNGVELARTTRPSYLDEQASTGQAYTYEVEASDEAGNVSAPGATVVPLGNVAPPGQRAPFLPGSSRVVAAGDSMAVCGRLGTQRDQRVGCRLRTLGGWHTVRTGRQVGWGLPETQTFLPSADGKVWFCRVLPGREVANACVPLDVATRSWGFDRVDVSRRPVDHATWVPATGTPARCAVVAERARCAVLGEQGWRTSTTDPAARPGEPLSRAFVGTVRGVSFCRSVAGRPTCTDLSAAAAGWGRTRRLDAELPRGSWAASPEGPTLCLPASCRTLDRPKG